MDLIFFKIIRLHLAQPRKSPGFLRSLVKAQLHHKPYGHEAGETIWGKEGIVYAVPDMQAVPSGKMEHDVYRHYARNDVLQLEVDESEFHT